VAKKKRKVDDKMYEGYSFRKEQEMKAKAALAKARKSSATMSWQ
jgi:hypothetical protein